MEWNSQMERYTVEIRHLDLDRLITKSVAQVARLYEYMPFCVFLFADPSGEAKRVTPRNLGDEVQFYVYPGPDGQPPEEW